MVLYATRSWDYGVLKFLVNGEAGGPADGVDLFSGGKGKVSATGAIDLGVHAPANGRFILRAEVAGGNEKAEGSRSFFGLDAVVVTAPK